MVDDEEAILRSLPASTVLLSGPKPVQHELPWIHRDDVDGLAEFISKYWTLRNQAKAPFALILSGGHSQRMGQDKGRLVYHDCDQVSYLSRLLSSLGLEGALSARAEQYSPDLWPQLPRIYDKFHGFGPMGALLTGLWEYPLRPLLLLPCDRPGLRSEHLASLCEARHWSRGAVIGEADGQLDPCFGIYEPEVAPFLFQALADRQLSLSRLLPQLRVQALPLTLGPNCNSPEERHHYMVKF
jgi:molybdopterin-guanine dinucleotide biosynthesis protein A